jgi:hypothetical protein
MQRPHPLAVQEVGMSVEPRRKPDRDPAALFEEGDKLRHVFAKLMRVLPAQADAEVRTLANDPPVSLEIASEEDSKEECLSMPPLVISYKLRQIKHIAQLSKIYCFSK